MAARREHEECDRGAPEREEEKVADPLSFHRLIRDTLQEHERRKTQHSLPLPVREVNEHRHRESGEPEKEPGGEQTRHQRTRMSRSRLLRKSNSA